MAAANGKADAAKTPQELAAFVHLDSATCGISHRPKSSSSGVCVNRRSGTTIKRSVAAPYDLHWPAANE